MDNSYKFFNNSRCEYYPCHKADFPLNCLFCFCPLYSKDKCPGTPRYIIVNGAKIKDCSDCVFPHKAENYETILKLLASK
ncbi:MAG: metal-binding protein [Oscillospiraceae bacterium]|nr:metal-binding protein [Oscillospiraceae bacterium]